MKHIILIFACLIFCSASFAQKLSKNKTQDLILKLAHKKDMSSSKTFSVPACLLDSIVGSQFDSTTNAWEKTYKEAFMYNAQSNTTAILFYNVIYQPLTVTSSITLSYNSQGTLTLSLSNYLDVNSNTWTPSSRTTYTYNASGDEIKELDENWDTNTNAWVNGLQISYSYTPTHSVTIEMGEYWSSNAWQNEYKITTAYNAASNPTLIIFAQWEQSTSTFDSLQKISINYTGNNMTSSTSFSWEQSTSTWENEFNYAFTYSVGNIILEQEQTWFNNAWENRASYAYTYDNHNNMLTEQDTFLDINTGLVQEDDLYNYYYKCNLVGIKELSAKPKFNLYPSPAQSVLSIESETAFEGCKIINISGQLVFESHELVKSISVSNLEKGIYFIQLLDKNKNVLATEKFVKD